MLSRDEIIRAVSIQQRSYHLLRWLGDAIDRGFISFSRAHEYTTAAEAAFDWISEHYMNLPQKARPEQNEVRFFSNFFGSYVTTSFELLPEPEKRLLSSCGCDCGFCARLANASRLRVMKPTTREKDRAVRKCVARLEMLAVEEGLYLTPQQAATIVASLSHRRHSAYSAYGLSLLERVRGSEGGLHVLALWRMIAWKPEGSPIKNFTLKAEDISEAEQQLLAAIRQVAELRTELPSRV